MIREAAFLTVFVLLVRLSITIGASVGAGSIKFDYFPGWIICFANSMQIVNLIGLVLNLFGTFVVSLSAGKLFTRIHTALVAHEATIDALLHPEQWQGVPHFIGLEEGRAQEVKRSDVKLIIGLVIIIVGFLLQVIAALAELH